MFYLQLAAVDVVLGCARTADCFSTLLEKPEMRRITWSRSWNGAVLSFFKYFKYSVTQAASPRFGVARVKEEAFHIWLHFQNSLSVCGERGVRSKPVSLDVLSANVADVIMGSKISPMTRLGALLQFCLQKKIASSSPSPVTHLSAVGDEKAALEKQLKFLDLLSPSPFPSVSDSWHFETRADKYVWGVLLAGCFYKTMYFFGVDR